MKTLPRNCTSEYVWKEGGLIGKFFILAPLLVIMAVCGGLGISALTNNVLYFLFGYPLGIVIAITFGIISKRLFVDFPNSQ